MTFETTKLANGVVIATSEMPHMQSVCTGFWALVGARHEPARHNGIAHFVEHVLFKGTGTRSPSDILTEVEGAGGTVNAFTEQDHTCYYAKVAADKLPEVTDVLADMYLRSVFPMAEVEREREVIGEEIVMYAEQPGQHVEDLLSAAAWPGSPLGRPITGTAASLAHTGRDDLLHFVRANYCGKNTLVTVAGRVTHGDVVDLLEPLLASLPGGARPRWRKFVPGGHGGGVRVVVDCRDIEQAHLYFGFHAPGRSVAERFVLKILSVLLGENMSSRLFQSLREERGLCYSVQSDLTLLQETGLFSVYAGVDGADAEGALKLAGRELRRIARRPPSKKELQKAIDYTVGMLRLSLESTTQQMFWLGESLIAHGRVCGPEVVCERLAAVTPAEVTSLAARLFRPENLALAAVGPCPDPAGLRSALVCGLA